MKFIHIANCIANRETFCRPNVQRLHIHAQYICKKDLQGCERTGFTAVSAGNCMIMAPKIWKRWLLHLHLCVPKNLQPNVKSFALYTYYTIRAGCAFVHRKKPVLHSCVCRQANCTMAGDRPSIGGATELWSSTFLLRWSSGRISWIISDRSLAMAAESIDTNCMTLTRYFSKLFWKWSG